MRVTFRTTWLRRLAAASLGTTLLLGDCDPTIQGTVEDGIINVSTTLLTSTFQALIQIFSEAQSTTAMLLPAILG